ncbi:MAG: hypothetical protein PWQ48_190 [Thermotogaceae bacterium]|nr:hypothetical protein [Thermotogaceae bacterium]
MGMNARKNTKTKFITLKNGLKLVLEDIEDFRSVSIGLGILGGSVSDPPDSKGMAHLIEHMVFKGTKKRNSFQIKEPIEKSGGVLNAFTSREVTFYYAKIPYFKILEAIDIIFDMAFNPLFDGEDLMKEKEVIVEEIKHLEDDPYGKIHDIFLREAFNNSNYGSTIFGSIDSVLKISKMDILNYHNRFYNASNMILSIAGRITDELTEKIREIENTYQSQSFSFRINPPKFEPKEEEIKEFKRDINQVHLLMGTAAPGRRDEDFFAFSVFNTLFGDGMSSRLFNKIREEEGLAYNIHTEYLTFGDIGLFLIYSSTSPEKLDRLLLKLQKEIEDITQGSITREELEYGKERIKGELLLATENTFSRMYKNFEDVRIFDKVLDVDWLANNFDSVTIQDLLEITRKYFKDTWLRVLLNPKH